MKEYSVDPTRARQDTPRCDKILHLNNASEAIDALL